MYTDFYGLARKPFNMTPDPSFLFLTKQHREALAGLVYAVLERKGFLVLSGLAGCGKTTLLSWVLQKLPGDRVQSSVILNPTLTREEFLEMVMLDFGMKDIPQSKARRLWLLQDFLLEATRNGKTNVLIVDEAHKLSVEVLEEIRLLGNLENGDEKLIQILLIGQRELDDLMNRPDLWQLKQRVSVRLAIEALSTEDVESYITHRWTVAKGKLPLPFAPAAIAAVGKQSMGIPRLINSICDNAMMLAFAAESHVVNLEHIETASQDLGLTPVPPKPKPDAVPPVAAPLANGTGLGIRPMTIKTLESYEKPAPPQKASMIGRLVHKIWYGSNGKNHV